MFRFGSFSIKNGAFLATVSSDDNSFECHLRLNQLASAQFVCKPVDERSLHIIRLLSNEGKSLLSIILHADQTGEYEDGAVEFWEKLRSKFGDVVPLTDDA